MPSNIPSPDQPDFFNEPVFASREALPEVDFDRFRSRIKRALSGSIREHHQSRDGLCQSMETMPGIGSFSRTMLDNYTSESKHHDISLVRFKALTRALNAPHLWDLVVSDEGLLILEGDEARLAEIARLQQEARAIRKQLSMLKSQPVRIRRGEA